MTDKTKKSHVQRLNAVANRVLRQGTFSQQDAQALVTQIEHAADRVIARSLAAKRGTKHSSKLNNG